MLKESCNQGEAGYNNLLSEVIELRKRLEESLPHYLAAVRTLYQKRDEFDRRYAASWVSNLLEKVRMEYQQWLTANKQIDMLSKLTVIMADIVLVAAKQQPIHPVAMPTVVIAIMSDGQIRPALAQKFTGRDDVVLLTWESFEGLAQKLKANILQGKVILRREDQIPSLLHEFALTYLP